MTSETEEWADWMTPPPHWKPWPLPKMVSLRSSPEYLAQERRHRQQMTLTCVGMGLMVGAAMLYWWFNVRDPNAPLEPEYEGLGPIESVASARPTAQPVRTSDGREPITEALALPSTPEELAGLRKLAMRFVEMDEDEHGQERLLWKWVWGVRFPRELLDEDHPSVGEALSLGRALLEVAREDVAAAEADEPPVVADDDAQLEAYTCKTPTPGYFYRVREGEELLGEVGLAARALRAAVLELGQAQGLAPRKAEAKARRLAATHKAQEAYAKLVCESSWNAGGVTAGALLWLPPLRRSALLDRSRKRRVAVELQPWPDGKSKLEPPPSFRVPPMGGTVETS